MSKLPLVDLFDVIVIAGDDTERAKPDPEAFLLAVRKLGVSKCSCIFVGDKPFTDVKGAKAAGMRTILVSRRHWTSEVKADFTVSTLAEIKSLL